MFLSLGEARNDSRSKFGKKLYTNCKTKCWQAYARVKQGDTDLTLHKFRRRMLAVRKKPRKSALHQKDSKCKNTVYLCATFLGGLSQKMGVYGRKTKVAPICRNDMNGN